MEQKLNDLLNAKKEVDDSEAECLAEFNGAAAFLRYAEAREKLDRTRMAFLMEVMQWAQ